MAYTLDKLDRQIIVLLQRDGRMANVEVARELGVAEGTVRKRLERLAESGIIHVTAVVNPSVLTAATPVFVGLEVDLPRVNEVAAELAAMPEILRVAIVAGEYDIIVEAVLSSMDQLLPFLRDRLGVVPGVKDTETFQVLELAKWSTEWNIPQEVGQLKAPPPLPRVVTGGDTSVAGPSGRELSAGQAAKGIGNRPMRTVADLLAFKGYDVWWVSPETTVYDALRLMSDRGVGAVIVLDGDRLAGVLSERDYARKVILHGKASKDTLVGEIMSQRVVTIGPDAPVEVCMRIMTDRHIRHLPVLDGEKLAGLISIGDVVNAIIAEQRYMIDQLRKYHQYDEP
jgi:DNA-binding Lrp family transcriptional regulator/predicted transcriptional regulator